MIGFEPIIVLGGLIYRLKRGTAVGPIINFSWVCSTWLREVDELSGRIGPYLRTRTRDVPVHRWMARAEFGAFRPEASSMVERNGRVLTEVVVNG